MRRSIERDADVVTWFDIKGGMGAGQSSNDEMQEGVLKCTVVIIFLSDFYCGSKNCIREYLHAVRHSKFIIPVLVPKCDCTQPQVNHGWTGPGPDDDGWWQHAQDHSSCKDPDTGEKFSWSALSQFAPIDLRVEDNHNEAVLGMVKRKAVFEMVKRIQSRFYRRDHIQHTAAKTEQPELKSSRRTVSNACIDLRTELESAMKDERETEGQTDGGSGENSRKSRADACDMVDNVTKCER